MAKELENKIRDVEARFASETLATPTLSLGSDFQEPEPEEQDELLPDEQDALLDDDQEVADELDDELTEEPVKKGTTSKNAQKAAEQTKIIALKRKLQKLEQRNRELEQAQQQKREEAERVSLKQKYLDSGYEEDVADKMVSDDLRAAKQEEKLAIIEFREEYGDVLRRYPQSRNDTRRIMETMRVTGSNIETVCELLYSEPMSYEHRALAAANGTLKRRSADYAVSRAESSGMPARRGGLSREDMAKKEQLETEFLGGRKITNEKYLYYKSRHNL